MPTRPHPATITEEETRDLGFGSVVARESRRRLLNKDGSFNVERTGLRFASSLSVYHALLTVSWTRFLLALAAGYTAANALFAVAYVLCGPSALTGPTPVAGALAGRLLRAFFFSVQTLSTIGYGRVAPAGLAANILVAVEALVGLLGFALAAGLLFARFSRPSAFIVFSRSAVVAPYRARRALEIRIANARRSEIIELNARLVLSLFEEVDGRSIRRFHVLPLERESVVFFPLSWTIVHPIDEASPLFGRTEADLVQAEAEVLVLLTGIDETFSQTVHARSSYRADEIVWNARFGDVFRHPDGRGTLGIDMTRIDAIERLTGE